RHGVLQLGAADLEHVREFRRLRREGGAQRRHLGEQAPDVEIEREPDRRGIDVVRALRQVQVVERMQHLVVALRVSEELERAVAEHLVRVHVGRRACAALNDVDHELIQQPTAAHLLAGAPDRAREARVEEAELAVRHGGRLLDAGERDDKLRIDGDRRAGDAEILQGAQGVDAVVGVCGDCAAAQQVVFGSYRLRHESILALSCGLRMDDLDFSKPAGPQRTAPPPPKSVYDPAMALEFFRAGGKPEAVPAGTRFFEENEKAGFLRRDKVYLLIEGDVALSANGKPLGAVKAGEIFGEMAAVSDSPRTATATARTACRVIALDEREFQKALQAKPEFA